MANVVTPSVTIYLYKDEVSSSADYTIIADGDGKYLQSLPVGKYWFKVEGTYDGTPIAEEYKSFTVNEDNIVDWDGQVHTQSQTIQELILTCYLGISLLTINVSYDGSPYTTATVEVGENDDNHYPREAGDGTGGVYTVDNIKTNSTIPIKAIPDSGDTNLQSETTEVNILNSNKSVDITLYYYFNLKVISYVYVKSTTDSKAAQPPSTTSRKRVYPGSANLYDSDNNLVTTLTNVEGSLITSNKVKKGTYTLEIPGFIDSNKITYEDYSKEITIEKDTNNTDGLREITAYLEEVTVIDEPDDPQR